jgi:hypothetical protein
MSMFGLLKYRVDNLESTVYLNCAKHEVSDERLKLIEYKQIDIEVRSRQVNLVISGVEESSGESCIEIANDLINNTLHIDSTTFEISRAFRLGRILRPRAPHLRQYTKPPTRNILVTFRQSRDVDIVMNNAYKLRGTGVGFSRDYPKEITEARRALWQDFKDAREKYGGKNVQIIYPAALMVNRQIVKNMFPDWYQVLQGSRHTYIPTRVSNTIKKNNECIKSAFSAQINPDNYSNANQASPKRTDSRAMNCISEEQVSNSNPNLNISSGSASPKSVQSMNHSPPSRGKGPLPSKSSSSAAPRARQATNNAAPKQKDSPNINKTPVTAALNPRQNKSYSSVVCGDILHANSDDDSVSDDEDDEISHKLTKNV